MKNLKQLTTENLVEEIQNKENLLEIIEIDSEGFGYYIPLTEEQEKQREQIREELDKLYSELETREDAPEEYKEIFEENRQLEEAIKRAEQQSI